MGTELLDKKLDRAFQHLDENHNGVIEREDMVNKGSKLLAAFGEPPTSPKGTAVMDGMVRWWEALVAALDTDGDGVVSPQEFRTGMTSAFADSPTGFEASFRPMLQAVITLMDTDQDDRIGRAEFSQAHQVVANTTEPDAAQTAFGKLDLDQDGYLGLDELMLACKQFYTGRDEDAVGNALFP